jgi:para-nitrobenzyl esterase
VKFAESHDAASIADLRAKPAQELLDAQLKSGRGGPRFSPNVDGYFFPDLPAKIYAEGKQAKVPLLAGWNADEGSFRMVLRDLPPTPENFATRLKAQFGDDADRASKVYSGATEAEVKRAAGDLSGDQFIAFGTWKWIEMHTAAKQPVWRYHFEQVVPGREEAGAVHASEIEFVFQALKSKDAPWRPEDFKVSELMANYWTNFAKTGNPNGKGLPEWPLYSKGHSVMHLNSAPKVTVDDHRARYEFLDSLARQGM